MNDTHLHNCRRYHHPRICGLVIIIIMILLRPVALFPDQHRDVPQLTSRQETPERVLAVEATAYAYTGHRTFTGTWPQRGTVAVDPRVIPLGSRLWVEGYGMAVAEDTGGLIKGDKVDVYLESEVAVRKWGRRQVVVRILN